jgi:hypothetical protein
MIGRILAAMVAGAAASVVLLAAAPFPLASESRLAGLIDKLEGGGPCSEEGPCRFRIFREGKPVKPISQFTQLFTGDRIEVDPGASMRVHLFRSETPRDIEVKSTTLFTVPAPEAEATAAGNFLGGLASFVGWRSQEKSYIITARIKGREDGGPELPLFVHRRPVVAAGDRPFTVAWTGGKAPFRLRLAGETDGAVVAAEHGLGEDRRLPPRPLALAAGRYRVEITDAHGKTASAAFAAVDPAELPGPPAELQFDRLPPEMRTTATAAWLATVEGGRWTLEALILLTAVAGDYSPAEVLRLALTVGGMGDL